MHLFPWGFFYLCVHCVLPPNVWFALMEKLHKNPAISKIISNAVKRFKEEAGTGKIYIGRRCLSEYVLQEG